MQRIYSKLTKGFAVIASFLVLAVAMPTNAATLTNLSDTMTNVTAGATSNHTVKFKTPTGITASGAGTLTVTFTSFTGTPVFGDITMSHGASTGLETSDTVAASAASNTWGFSWGVPTLTLTVPTNTGGGYSIPAGNFIVITVGNTKLTNPSAGTYTVTIGGTGTVTDTGTLAVVTTVNGVVSVSASVAPSVTFTVSSGSLSLGALTTGAVASQTLNYTVTTNGVSGYNVTVKDTNAGLLGSGGNTITSSATTLSAGTVEGYGINAQAGGGSPTIAGAYNYATNQVGALATSVATLSSYTGPTTGSGDIVNVNFKASITGSTKAGSYADTATFVATANF